MKEIKPIILTSVFLMWLFSPVIASAETIVLKSGKTVEGKLIEKTDKYIKIDFQGVPLTYFLDEIESVDGSKMVLPPHQENPSADIGSVIKESPSSVDREAYEEKLVNVLKLLKDGFSQEKFTSAMSSLWQFSKDYPDSRFAIDAKFVYEYISFIGLVNAPDKEASLRSIKRMEEIIKPYPDGSLDELTSIKFKEVFGEEIAPGLSSRVTYIPFRYIVPYMRGYMAFLFKDYESTIDNFSLLKEKLDFSKDEPGPLKEIYCALAASYRLTNRIDKFNEVAKEAKNKFPNTPVADGMQKLLDAIESSPSVSK